MIEIGIIGAGNFSVKHIQAIQQIEGLRIHAICRTNPDELNKLKDLYQVKGYTDYRDLLNDKAIEAVLIATPHHLHAEVAIHAAKSGKHILLEKPFATSWKDCNEIHLTCKENGVKLMLAHTGQFTPAFKAAKKHMDSGVLGPIHMANGSSVSLWKHQDRKDWHLRSGSGGGYLFTVAVHQIDLICALIPSRVVGVYAYIFSKFHTEEVDDAGILMLHFENGASASINFAGFTKGVNHVETDFYGQEGMLRINFTKGAFWGRNDHWELLPGSYEEDWMGMALVNEWKAFQRTIKLDLSSPVSGEHGLNVMEVIFAALESAKTHKEIPIQFNPEIPLNK